MPVEFGEGVKDLYESEKARIREVFETMGSRNREVKLLTPLEEAAWHASFARELTDRINEVGFTCEVIWVWQSEERHPEDPDVPLDQSPDTSYDPDDMSLVYKPKLVVTGRTAKLLDYDHDRQKFEVREGVFDGVKGVIDPNTGELREDPKRKDIY